MSVMTVTTAMKNDKAIGRGFVGPMWRASNEKRAQDGVIIKPPAPLTSASADAVNVNKRETSSLN
jgi:hypothetical protein